MNDFDWKKAIQPFDERRALIIPGDAKETVRFCTRQFIQIGQEAIEQRGQFIVALSGGKTPNAIFKELSQPENKTSLEWSKVICFWSDERSVPPTDSENNYSSAMQAGVGALPLKPENIFRMQAEEKIKENARAYEAIIREKVPDLKFDLIMLGMGEDGHTASLFPHTEGLESVDRLVIANYVPQKNTWRMSFTFECIHLARIVCIYAMGKNKAETVEAVLNSSYDPDRLPIQRVGTVQNKAYWILDADAGSRLR